MARKLGRPGKGARREVQISLPAHLARRVDADAQARHMHRGSYLAAICAEVFGVEHMLDPADRMKHEAATNLLGDEPFYPHPSRPLPQRGTTRLATRVPTAMFEVAEALMRDPASRRNSVATILAAAVFTFYGEAGGFTRAEITEITVDLAMEEEGVRVPA